MRSLIFLAGLWGVIGIAGCSPNTKDPQAIVDAAIEAHGGSALDHATLSFTFRGTPFSITRDGGMFEYTRIMRDSLGQSVQDVIDNEGTHRFVNGQEVAIDSITTRRIGTDVNSVAYFALLPIPLNDPAVRKRYVGTQTIRSVPYELVEVTFVPEGGGRDYQDIFVYWFHSDRHTLDYMAYTYVLGENETGPAATGIRFREAGNVRNVGGYRVQDYRNFTADAGTQLEQMALMYEAGDLRFVSDIQLENVRVEPVD
ncbi:MAG: DUF6503 family protein [Rubricoccaceae bacterium]|nr:DUF6503 family protein [Rubricoccaceae bacterium]